MNGRAYRAMAYTGDKVYGGAPVPPYASPQSSILKEYHKTDNSPNVALPGGAGSAS